MAVGDMVSGISAASTQLTFQPAASVVILITTVGAVNAWAKITDGTLTNGYTINTSTNGGQQNNAKLFINNSLYLVLDVTAYNTTYSGIQVQ